MAYNIPQQVARDVRTLLQNNLFDPNDYRRTNNKNWIYNDMPRTDASMPRIGIFIISDDLQPAEIGSTTHLSRVTMQVSIFVDKTEKYDVDDDGTVETSEYSLDYISDSVINTILNNQDSLRGDNIIHIIPTAENYQKQDGIYQKNLDFEIMMTR